MCVLPLSLSSSGKMYPTQGILYVAPFTDEALYLEQMGKTYFWYMYIIIMYYLVPAHNACVLANSVING